MQPYVCALNTCPVNEYNPITGQKQAIHKHLIHSFLLRKREKEKKRKRYCRNPENKWYVWSFLVKYLTYNFLSIFFF